MIFISLESETKAWMRLRIFQSRSEQKGLIDSQSFNESVN